MLSFAPLKFNWPANELKVALAPFQWNWLSVKLGGLGDSPDWSPIQSWFRRWFKEGDPEPDELL